MANNYTRATMTPTEVYLTQEQRLFLQATGAGFEIDQIELSPLEALADAANDEPADLDRYYVYWEEDFNECVDEEVIYELLVQEDQARCLGPNVQMALEERAKRLAEQDFTDVLHEILLNPENAELGYLSVEGANTCSKMRPGEFGGFVGVITREEWAWANTGSAIQVEDGQLVVGKPRTGKFETIQELVA